MKALLELVLLVLLAAMGEGGPLLRTVRRRQSEQVLVAGPREPSCAELRLMWRQMHRMARHSQISNEIPRISPSSHHATTFGQLLRQPPGRFLEYPLPESSLGGVFGTVIRSPDERQVDQQFGAFGRFRPNEPTSRRRQQQACRQEQGKRCTKDSQCVCWEAKLRCLDSFCRSPAAKKVSTAVDEWGVWHSGPLDSSQLGGAP